MLWTLLLLALVGANVGDAYTTHRILRTGGVELNPLLPDSPGRFLVAKVALTGVQVVALREYRKRHPKAAVVLGVIATVLPCIAIVHNLRQHPPKGPG